jgi:arylsulfatase A-like enzyme
MRNRAAKQLLFLFAWCCGIANAQVGAVHPNRPEADSRAIEVNRTYLAGRHVVVVVWDGMRPDLVSAENTPTLWKVAQGGVIFRNHHAVYPSATEVNGTALATGVYPLRSGLISNREYRPEIDDRKSIDTENIDAVRKGDALSGGKYLAVPTIAEIVRQNGRRTAIAAAKTVGLLLDRQFGVALASSQSIGKDADATSVTLFKGEMLPHEILTPLIAALGRFPAAAAHSKQDAWTTQALTDFLWKDGVPVFSLLWLSEPDDTQHKTAPGAPAALAAIKSSDENLGRVLAALDRRGLRASTDLFVVSDHGFSTISRAIDLRKKLKEAGFDVATEFTSPPRPGQVMLVGNGGTVLFYVIGREVKVVHRLVEFLQRSDFAGVVFTREPMEGTFGLDAAKIDPPSRRYGATGPPSLDHDVTSEQGTPDVAMSFRWSDSKNQFGISGMIDADWQRRAGEGTHATLSKFDMHNMLIAAGPDFQQRQIDDLPTGNIDLAPTILEILGIRSADRLDGRILSEAFVKTGEQSLTGETETTEAQKAFSSGTWRQTLQISRVGSTTYLDEGTGSFDSKR